MRGESILFGGGHLEVEISSCCGVYFLGGVAIFHKGMATFHIGIVYLLVKDV